MTKAYAMLVVVYFMSSVVLITLGLSITKPAGLDNKFSTYSNKRFGDYKVRWQSTENSGTPVVFLHGFGGNTDQFRKNMGTVASSGYKSYGLDLLGYGYSDKPNPRDFAVNELYNFETWGDQCVQFLEREVKEPAVLVCNSVGGMVGLQSAVTRPDLVKGVVLINISLRLLHQKKQAPLARPFISALQYVLRESGVGKLFFSRVATKQALKNILGQAYASNVDVTDEIVDIILQPGLEPGAAEVFLDFISYSGGPLPEELLAAVPPKLPVRILWGEADPWEPVALGRELSKFPCVDEFVTMPGGGHCPMDQIPDTVNREVLRFLKQYV